MLLSLLCQAALWFARHNYHFLFSETQSHLLCRRALCAVRLPHIRNYIEIFISDVFCISCCRYRQSSRVTCGRNTHIRCCLWGKIFLKFIIHSTKQTVYKWIVVVSMYCICNCSDTQCLQRFSGGGWCLIPMCFFLFIILLNYLRYYASVILTTFEPPMFFSFYLLKRIIIYILSTYESSYFGSSVQFTPCQNTYISCFLCETHTTVASWRLLAIWESRIYFQPHPLLSSTYTDSLHRLLLYMQARWHKAT